VNEERLLNVAKALRESKNPESFDMGLYVNGGCGTPACALGHYASRTDLQTAYRLKPDSEIIVRTSDGSCVDYNTMDIADHFEIQGDDLEDLFSPEGCGSALSTIEAAEFIEAFVARGGK
jgi:hypothetical protein